MQYSAIQKFPIYACNNYVTFMYYPQYFKWEAYIKDVNTIYWLFFCQHDANLDISEKEEQQLRKCLHMIDLYQACGIFLISN